MHNAMKSYSVNAVRMRSAIHNNKQPLFGQVEIIHMYCTYVGSGVLPPLPTTLMSACISYPVVNWLAVGLDQTIVFGYNMRPELQVTMIGIPCRKTSLACNCKWCT